MITSFKSYWEKWAKKRNRSGNPQVLNSRNIYILPTKFGLVYGMVILVLFLIAVNYQVNLIFLMTFLLVTISFLSAWEAHANLKSLSFRLITVEDAHQGTPAKMVLFIEQNNKNRFGVEFQIGLQPKIRLAKVPQEGIQFILPIETTRRGRFYLLPIIISSLYPFGIFKVWSYLYFEEHYYVYPQPIDPGFWPTPYVDQHIQNKFTSGDEEYYDLKQVENPWTEPNLIAWKIAAKGQGWFLKKMKNHEDDYWLFKLNDLPTTNLELKLQNLSYWLQAAETNGQIYGLKLQTVSTPFAHGKDHLHHCLRQLALYQ